MGKSAGDEFLRYLHRPDESHCKTPRRCCSSGKLSLSMVAKEPAAMASDFTKSSPRRADYHAQVRLALGFLRETEPEMQDLMLFRCAITRSFSLPRAFTGALKPFRLISLQTAPDLSGG